MKVVDRFKVSKEPEGPRKFTFEFTGAGLVSVAVVALLGVIWVFILGVLLGRGYKPENAVPQVAQIMPSAPSAAQENKEQPTVLKPEELQFQDTLQGKKPPETVTVESTAQKEQGKQDSKSSLAAHGAAALAGGAAATALERTPAPLPKGQVPTAVAQPDRKTQPAPAASKQAAKPPKDAKSATASKDAKDAKTQKYHYTYQFAALDTRNAAQAEADKLGKKGIKAGVEEVKIGGKTLYRVSGQLKGSPAEVKQALEKAGAKKPILREKKSL